MATKVTFKEFCQSKGITKPVIVPVSKVDSQNSFVICEEGKANSGFCWISKKSASSLEEVFGLLKNGQILSVEIGGSDVPYLCREGQVASINLDDLV